MDALRAKIIEGFVEPKLINYRDLFVTAHKEGEVCVRRGSYENSDCMDLSKIGLLKYKGYKKQDRDGVTISAYELTDEGRKIAEGFATEVLA